MTLPEKLKSEIEPLLTAPIVRVQPLSGGSISQACIIATADNSQYFIKYQSNTCDNFIREAEGLVSIQATNSFQTPVVIRATSDYLLQEYIVSSPPERSYWPVFGRLLAKMHRCTSSRFGFEKNNYCGATPQQNTWSEHGHKFFNQHRLLYQATLAQRNHLLSDDDVLQLQSLCGRLEMIIPSQPASLLHGDLWHGNHLCNQQNHPTLIDPACYYGWAEADLAMTQLFGGFPEAFYAAYQEANPLEQGWKSRFPIYNLYHLLNHLNVFGRSYYSPVMDIIRRY